MTHARLIALLIIALGSSVAFAQVTDAGRTPRRYDLRELLTVFPGATDAPGLNGAGPATQPADLDRAERDKIVSQLWKVLTGTARANEPAIEVAETDALFTVTATTQQHERIDALTRAWLRRPQITTEMRMISLTRKGLEMLEPALADKLRALRQIPGRAELGETLSDAEVQSLIATVQKDVGGSQLTAPRVTTFDGQRAFVVVATKRPFNTDFAKDAAGAWQPKTTEVQTGVTLDVRARAGKDRQVALEAKVQWMQLLAVEEKPLPAAPELKVQVPQVAERVVDALFAMEDGMTVVTCPVRKDGPESDDTAIYYVFRATIVPGKS